MACRMENGWLVWIGGVILVGIIVSPRSERDWRLVSPTITTYEMKYEMKLRLSLPYGQ